MLIIAMILRRIADLCAMLILSVDFLRSGLHWLADCLDGKRRRPGP